MDRLNRDLTFFRRELEKEKDPLRRELILEQMVEVEKSILEILREERRQAERENRNLQEALEACLRARSRATS